MILFTSDLDRTLIYSNTMVKTYPIDGEIKVVEYKDKREITYMSEKSINLLQQFNEDHIFVPVTTRAFYQYERIHKIAREINPKYAITSNGGTVLIDGKPDMEWSKSILNHLTETSSPKEDMIKEFNKIRHESWVAREFYIDNLFYMFHVNKESIPHNELANFKNELGRLGWHTFLHGKKLYVLPINLKKMDAVNYVKSMVEYDIHVAAGDSLMDYDMIKIADYGYSPPHGELFEMQGHDTKVNWLNNKGIVSTEELMQTILDLDLLKSKQ